MKIFMAVVLSFFSLSACTQEVSINQPEPTASCVLSENFAESEVAQLILMVEEQLIESGADMETCMGEYASQVKGCFYAGAKVSIMKNPSLGWAITVERDGVARGAMIDYQGKTTIAIGISDFRYEVETDQIAGRPEVFAALHSLLLGASELERFPLVRYEVDR